MPMEHVLSSAKVNTTAQGLEMLRSVKNVGCHQQHQYDLCRHIQERSATLHESGREKVEGREKEGRRRRKRERRKKKKEEKE